MVVFSLSQPVRSRILNYKNFVSELDLDRFLENENSVKCYCSEYSTNFIDNERKHILTGNLQIIKNNKLRKLFCKGPKFREPVKIKWEDARSTIQSGIDNFIDTVSDAKRVSKNYFQHLKCFLLELVDEKITKYSSEIK